MKLRSLFGFGVHSNGGVTRQPRVIPYNPVHKARCPWCGSVGTMYIPSIAEGHCDACGGSWRFLSDPEATFDRPKVRAMRIDYNDLLGFCVAMKRLKISYRDARERYGKLGIVSPEEQTWERAWREAKDFT
jgi:hypothetical protein